jgi:hypothetical protein
MGYGFRCQVHWFECVKNQANLTQLWEALESTWASITVECYSVVHARQIEAVLIAKGGATQY